MDIKNERAKPVTFIADKGWLNVLALSRHSFGPGKDGLAFFRELPESIGRNQNDSWKSWIDKNDPENPNHIIPDFHERMIAEKDIGPFMKLCLVRSLREDRTLIASNQFIEATLDKSFTNPISYPIE